jgi:uncharacterized protein involved in outer membrane biogenesis
MSWSEFKAKFGRYFSRQRGKAAESTSRTPRPRPRHRVLKWTGGILASLVAVIVLVLVFLDWNAMRGPIGRYLTARLHREVRIGGDLDVKLFSWTPTAVVNDLRIAQPQWLQTAPQASAPFADVQRLTISLDLKQLLGWRIVLPTVDIEEPRLRLLRETSGRANWDFGEGKSTGPFHLPPIRHFAIRDGRINLDDAIRKLTFAGTISSEETDNAGGQQFFHLGGKGQLNHAAFSADVRGDPLLNVRPDKPYAFQGHVQAGATKIDATGSLNKPFDLGALQVKASFAGPDLADLYYLTGLTLPNTPAYKISGNLTRDQAVYRFSDLRGTLGQSDLHGDLTVDVSGDKPYLKGDIASNKLNFDDLGPLIGVKPGKEAGAVIAPAPKTAKKSVALTPTAPTSGSTATRGILPDTPLDAVRLREMNADVHYRATTVVSRDFPLRGAETRLSLKDGVLKMTPVVFNFAHGTLKGDVQIDARKNVPASDIDVRLTGLELGQFVPSSSKTPALEGQAVARAKLHGVGDSIHKAASTANGTVSFVVPHGEIRQTFAELLGINVAKALGLLLTNDQSTVNVRCAVAGFSSKNGVLTLDQFAFDTPVVLASGEGTVDLKNERLALSITGHPKKPQLIRVRAPITVSGPLGHPAIGVDAGSAIVQGGLSAALAVVLSPLAAILPFVDPGLSKDADCSALLAQARSQGAPVTQKQAQR